MKENKYWNPMTFGEKRDDEVVCYTVAIPNLPLRPNRRGSICKSVLKSCRPHR